MERRLILGTAGHIDHGKTALVRALSGVDTDRLKEEKRRGITIELGFAPLRLPSGLCLGIVDVPGHERFVDHMVAGATGIDLVLLVVAADEGVMPQTTEHLEICRLLGVRTGLVALTKADLVDEEMRALAEEDVEELVQGTFLEGRPVVPFSAVTGQGSEALLAALDEAVRETAARRADGVARMPIDRVFTMRGFGTVVTGTQLSGTLSVGKTVEILPSGHQAKIRGLQIHNDTVETVGAGSRAAVNLQGIEKLAVQRGDVLVEPGHFRPSHRVHVRFEHVPSAPRALPDRFRLMVHWGTARSLGRILFLDGSPQLEPGGTCWAQLALEAPVLSVFGDRLIVRDFSTNQTLGGALVVDPHAPRFKKKLRPTLLPWLERVASQDPADAVAYFLWKAGVQGASLRDLTGWTPFGMDALRGACETLGATGEIVRQDPEPEAYIHREHLASLCHEALEQIRAFHDEEPYREGMPREALGGRLRGPVPDRVLHFTIEWLAKRGEIQADRDLVRAAGHSVELTPEDRALCERIRETLDAQGTMPPTVKELAEALSHPLPALRTLLEYLRGTGDVVKLTEELYYASPVLEDLRRRLVEHLREKGEIETVDFKTLSGTTRKYTIPLLEYFDRTRLTLRLGDRRVLRDKKA